MPSRRNVVMAAASVGALLTLAGCGSGGSSTTGSSAPGGASPSPSSTSSAGSPLAAVQAAYASTVGKKSARLSLVEHVNAGGHALTITGKGLDDFAGKKLALVTTIAGRQIQIREVDHVLYEHLPAGASAGLPGAKPWLSIDLDALLKHSTGASLSEIEAGQQDDPASILGYLRQASASGLHRVGTASIRGVSTTEYTATIDLDKVAAADGGALAKVIRTEERTLGSSSYPISVWVDGQGLVRQVSYHLTVSPTAGLTAGGSGAPAHAAVSATMQLYDFGTPVTVTAPPASQTTNLTKVLQGLAAVPQGSGGAPAA